MLALEPLVNVWRVELADGTGPYSWSLPPSAWDRRANQHGEQTGHPAPDRNGLSIQLVGAETHHYGFATLPALEEWFDSDDRKLLAEAGFESVHFRAPRSSTHYGRQQLLFVRELSIEISRRPVA